jgi:aerobic carbon-monoxide dehydrogenase medium subunit
VKAFEVEQPTSLSAALALMCSPANSNPPNFDQVRAPLDAALDAKVDAVVDARAWLAGGQSLLAAMKLGMNEPEMLIDLQSLTALRGIERSSSSNILQLGAMETHARIASSDQVRQFCPNLADLAHGIGDQQVRNMGTIGGSLANNDPAACWPAALLALRGSVQTSQREVVADEFFNGIFTTALKRDELILQIRFPRPDAFKYIKFEQPASRFALLGLAVARFDSEVRVAITGLGHGVTRWSAAEEVLSKRFAVEALADLHFPVAGALSDLHASAEYRAHLAGVLCRRAVSALVRQAPQAKRNEHDAIPHHFFDRAWSRLLNFFRR